MSSTLHHLFLPTLNGNAISLKKIPVLKIEEFHSGILTLVASGCRISSFFAVVENSRLFVILADDAENKLYVGSAHIPQKSFPSLTPMCPQAHLFEREIAEQTGLVPVGHPWLKPVRGATGQGYPQHESKDSPSSSFYRMAGDEVHEVAVGPVHAGVIEPGHFRFQCHGETVYHLEIALGYQHRGIEEAMVKGSNRRNRFYAETIAGDTTIAHSICHSQLIEALSYTKQSARAEVIRGIALELERLANHSGDLGALAADVGFLPTSSYCGRIRGEFLNMTAVLCGNRFGRGLIIPGGVAYDLDQTHIDDLLRRLEVNERDITMAANLLWDNQSVMSRFENTGTLPQDIAIELGIVGPAARASGLMRDVRFDQPTGLYRFCQVNIPTYRSGDVLARAYIRWLEIQQSITFIRRQLLNFPKGEILQPISKIQSDSLAVSLSEGWRGEVCHVAITGKNSRLQRYKIVDPSFHNWSGLAYALRNQEISDFPLCNKSFNLSYCGFDL